MFSFDDFNTGAICNFRDFASKGEMQNINIEFCDWRFRLVKDTDDNGITVTPLLNWSYYLYTPWLIRFPYVSIRVLFEPVNHLGESNEEFKYTDRFYYETGSSIRGKKMHLSEILDTKNGWLSEDGTFTWNVAFSIDALQDKQGFWRFNFLDLPFKTKWGPDVVEILDNEEYAYFTTHRLMLKLHCPRLPELLNGENRIVGCPRVPTCSNLCLNILHGVQVKFEFETDEQFYGVLEVAKNLGFPNVLHYCERQLIEDAISVGDIKDKILFSIQTDFNQYLSILLKELKQRNELLEILKKADIGMMSGESMKICVKKLLYSTE
ncbi:unnamed protein product [Caenorhabditis brenneri]